MSQNIPDTRESNEAVAYELAVAESHHRDRIRVAPGFLNAILHPLRALDRSGFIYEGTVAAERVEREIGQAAALLADTRVIPLWGIFADRLSSSDSTAAQEVASLSVMPADELYKYEIESIGARASFAVANAVHNDGRIPVLHTRDYETPPSTVDSLTALHMICGTAARRGDLQSFPSRDEQRIVDTPSELGFVIREAYTPPNKGNLRAGIAMGIPRPIGACPSALKVTFLPLSNDVY